MRSLLVALWLAIPLCLNGQTAGIKINTDRVISEIDPKIYGVFMELINLTVEENESILYIN
jgi:alpha-L-arabinofuranosidase